MKPELLFLCAGVFACAAALFGIASGVSKGREDYTWGVLICGVIAVFFLLGGIDELRRMKKGGP